MKIFSFTLVLLFVAMCFSQTAFSAKNILVFGDSLSAGYGIALEQSWPNLLQKELVRTQSPFNVVNASISGETTTGGLQRIGKALKQHQPAIVIVELGANDGLRGYNLADTERNLDKIIAQSKRSKAKVLLVGMQLPPNYGETYETKFRELYQQLAKKHRIVLLPFLLEGVTQNQFQPDNLHPTADAQQHIMLNILQELKHLLH
ncbi:MAG: arylesterase [Gallionella sp.]